ncbi:MAG: DUF3553 domain-containing protein [Geminicoccaceae bacterium]
MTDHGPSPDPGLTPGAMVRNPAAPEWGLGQVQSAIGWRVTANFEQRGKLTLDLRHVRLEIVGPTRRPSG